MKPRNAEFDLTTQLEVVDSFLSEKNNHISLKKTIDIVKPFFFQIVNEKLEQESSKLLRGMR
mgnify:CR=1 FL=1